MPINNITQTISELPAAGRRGVDVQTVFVTKQEDFQDHLQGTTVTELNTLKDQLNSRIGEINSTATTMNGYASEASAGASIAATKASEASAGASGALTSRNQASTFATNSSNSATKASQWADNNYNVEVEAGRYSAKHWSTVAETIVVDTVKLTGNQTIAGVKTFSSSIVGGVTGNAGTATKLATARTINGVSFDGSANITVVDSTKAPLASPTFTGIPTAPTAAADTSTTQLATTAFAIPRVTGVDNAIVRFDGNTGKVQTSNITIDDSGNLNITGTGARITGDFSNGTHNLRVGFQTSINDGVTFIGAFPNGINKTSGFATYNNPDANNASIGSFSANNTAVRIMSVQSGTGSELPMTFNVGGGNERLRIDTSGNVLVTGAGALGYGTGSGGTVTQLTSKSTAVTLNKPTGHIIMHNSALAQNNKVAFLLFNSLIANNDTLLVSVVSGSSVLVQYEVRSRCSEGVAEIIMSHTYAGSLSEALIINFSIIKGAIA